MAEWKPIDELFDYEKGTLQSSKCTPGNYTFITAAEEWKTHEIFTHDCEALIFAMAASGSLGRTHYINGKFISSDLCFILTPKKGLRLNLTFYHRLFNFLRADIVKKTATGTSKLAINQTNFGAYKLPYFDYEHQLIFRDKIETIRGINEEFFDGMNYQLSLLEKLRQSVLQDAIGGRLTEDWRKKNFDLISGENHASKLLEKIKAEKERLIKEQKIKKEKIFPSLSDKEKFFDLPIGWVWCRLGEIGDPESYPFVDGPFGSSINTKKDYIDAGIPVLRMINVKPFRFLINNLKFVSQEKFNTLKRHNVRSGDILFSKVGAGIGEACVVPENFTLGMLATTGITRLRVGRIVLPEYLCIFLNVNGQQFKSLSCNTAQPFLNMSMIKKFPFVLPPLNEQRIIIERTKELISMIDELKIQACERKEQSEVLMRSVLKEAFESQKSRTVLN